MTLNIVHFLTEYRNRLQNDKVTPFTTNALALVDILLTTSDDGHTYPKIGLFRKPDDTGTLDKIPLMVEGRAKIRELINNHTTYTTKLDYNFGYTLSDTAKLKMFELVEVINTGITLNMKKIGQELQAAFNSVDWGSLAALTNYYQKSYTQLTAIVNGTSYLTPKLLVDRLERTSNDMNVSISHDYLADIAHQEEYINFLQNFTVKKLPVSPNDWVTGLKGCLTYLEDNKNWYKFLAELYDEYSQYEIQKSLSLWNVVDINDWGQMHKPQGIFINADNFWTFVNKQKHVPLIKNERPDEFRLNSLNALLNVTLRHVPAFNCIEQNTILQVMSDYVQLNNIEGFSKICGNSLRKIHVYAAHTVFIDGDIDGNDKRLEVVIMAPNWFIYGDRSFNLMGSNSGPVTTATVVAKPNSAAEAGVPGMPGGNAGSFYGIGLKFINGEKLKIIGKSIQGEGL